MDDTLVNRHGGAESQLPDFVVADLVVPLVTILARRRRLNLARWHALLNDGGDLVLGEVHVLVADVVRLARHHFLVLDGKHEGAGSITDMEEGASEVTLVQVEVLDGQCLEGQVIDEKIEPHTRGNAEDGVETESRAFDSQREFLAGALLLP